MRAEAQWLLRAWDRLNAASAASCSISPGAHTFRRAIVMPVRRFFMLPSGWRTHSCTGAGGGVRRLSRTESDMPLIAEGT